MRTTIANLKHLYQCLDVWWYYLVFAMIGTLKLSNEREYFWLWFGLINLVLGFGISMLQKEILSRPLTYCLPGHRTIPCKIILSVGIVFNVLLSLLIILCRNLIDYNPLLIILSVSSVGLTIYLIAALCILATRNRILFPVILAALIAILFFVKSAPQNLTSNLHTLLPIVAVITAVTAYLLIQGESLARKSCGKTSQGFPSSNKASNRVAEQASYAAPNVEYTPRVEGFFLRHMRSCKDHTTARFIWSDLYLTFAEHISYWKIALFTLAVKIPLSALLFFAIFRNFYNVSLPLLITTAIVLSLTESSVRLPAYSCTPTLTGRRQRFYSILTLASLITGLMTLLIIITAGIAALLEPALPGIFATFRFSCLILVPLTIVPATLTIDLSCTTDLAKGLFYIAFFFLFFGLCARFGHVFTTILIISACAWPVFILTAHYVCAKRGLVQKVHLWDQ